nr:ionotropic receptor 75d [Achelura yunnanensis]
MGLSQFVVAYFVSKNVTLLTTFLCCSPELLLELPRAGQQYGMRISAQANFDRLPALPAYDWHREGALVDVSCPHSAIVINKASENRAFIHRYSWLVIDTTTGGNSSKLNSALSAAQILPDADVTWLAEGSLAEVYKVKDDHPLIITELHLTSKSTLLELRASLDRRPPAVSRRKDLRSVCIEAAAVITRPELFHSWTDLTMRHVDKFTKFTYPLMMNIAEDLNCRYNMSKVSVYGVGRAGQFSGAAGMLQRREVQLVASSIFMRKDRLNVMHYCSETVALKSSFLFRQPSQSSVANMFLLPFSRGVWAASGAAAAAAGALLALVALVARCRAPGDDALAHLHLAEAFTFAIGTLCQQGYHMTPQLVSARMVMLFSLLTSLAAFTSYSAKIVAILQTPSNAIRTIRDLDMSPMHLATQNTSYKKIYFAESNDPETQALYRHKLLPLGEAADLSVEEGVARVRKGLFAFQVEESAGYDIISKTFTEPEKCDLKEIEAYKLPMVAVPLLKHSGYRELFASRMRWQRETGLMGRARRVWVAGRVQCAGARDAFVSVSARDAMPALHALAAGAALAALLLLAEILLKMHAECVDSPRRG